MLLDKYGLFTLVSPNNLHICMSKILKEAVIGYLSSEIIFINLRHTPNKSKTIVLGTSVNGCASCVQCQSYSN